MISCNTCESPSAQSPFIEWLLRDRSTSIKLVLWISILLPPWTTNSQDMRVRPTGRIHPAMGPNFDDSGPSLMYDWWGDGYAPGIEAVLCLALASVVCFTR